MESLRDYEPIVGVDLAPDLIRATQIERVGTEYYLRNIGTAPTPEGCIEEGRIVRPSAMARAIKQLFRERQFDTSKVYTAVRGKGVISRIITLPSMPQERLRRLIEAEVNRYVLFSEDDKVVYYHPIEEFDEHDRRKISVMLVVAQKSLCRSYYETFKEAGLELAGIDLSTFSILRELRNSMPDSLRGNTMSLVFDYQGVAMSIFNGDTLKFSRNIGLGGMSGPEMTNGFLDKLIGEVLLALHYYQSEYTRGEMVQRLVLSLGASGGMEVFNAVKSSVEDIPVEEHSPFGNIKLNVDEFPASVMEQVDSNFLTSVGLALRGQELEVLPFQVDLLPQEIAESKLIFEHMKLSVRWLMVMLIALSLAYLGIFNAQRFVDREKVKLDYRKEDVKHKIDDYMARKQETMRLNPLPMDVPATQNMSPVFEEIKRIIPRTVQLTGLRIIPPETMEFKGIAEANPSIFYFVSSLKNSKYFSDIELGPHSDIEAFGRRMVGFTIRCKYKAAK